MGSEAETLADAGPLVTSKGSDTSWDYVRRGRRFEYMETEALKAMWVSIVRKMSIEPINRGLLLASNDVDTELQIRGDNPRYGKAEVDAYLRSLRAAMSKLRKTDPDEWKRVATEMTADVERFTEQNQELRLSRELPARRLTTWSHSRKSAAGVPAQESKDIAARRESSNRDAPRHHASFRDRAETH